MSTTPGGFRHQLGRREFVGFGLGAFVAATIPLARRRPPAIVRRTVPVMGTVAEFAVVHRDAARAGLAIDAAVAELRWVERTMTRFTDTSDIGRANVHAAREGVAVAAETAFVTAEALRWADALDGRYDPAVGSVTRLWEVAHRHEPPPDERIAALAARRFHRAVEVGARGSVPVLRFQAADARLDLGSVAKGYAVDRAAAALRAHGIGHGLVVAGGDLYAIGTAPDDEPWSVGIQSPVDEREVVGMLRLTDRAVATSGTYRQFFRHRGRRYHHLMDPVSARPRETAMQSLTIVADSVMHADAASTALFGMPGGEIQSTLDRLLPGAELARVL